MDDELLYEDAEVAETGFYNYWAKHVQTNLAFIVPLRGATLVKKYLETRDSGNDRLLGIDLKLEQASRIPWFGDALYKLADKVIFLRRLNLLKQVISTLVMESRLNHGAAEVHRSSTPKKEIVSPSPRHVISMMADLNTINDTYDLRVKLFGVPCLRVYYEDLVSNETSVLWQIQKFLGVAEKPLSSPLAKQNPYPLKEIIGNFDEVRAAVLESEFGYTLHLPT